MSSVDSRIVTMKFDNAQFEQGARTSLSTLEKLKQSLNFGTVGAAAVKGLSGISSILSRFGIKNPFAPAQQGLSELNRSTNQFGQTGLGAIEGGITRVSKSFLAMSTIALTALSNITTKAMQTGSMLVKSLTTDPITGGLKEYETNLNSIQTILANTKVSGANLRDVNDALLELNHYSDKTIYNFSEMARNIGTFTAAGVDLDTSVASIKGIANLAALSGSNSQQAASAMYQLSQEIAAGRVSLMGWNSVVNAGMGGSTFQRALAETAVAMGEIDAGALKLQGKMKNVTVGGQSFRDSIMAKPGEQSWLTSKVLTNTLKQFTGDMSAAELAAQGFTKAQIEAIRSQAKTAVDAATKVKTLTGVLDTAKEVVGSGWAQTWQIVFGDFKEARTLFTNVSNTVNDVLTSSADARNKILGDWDKLGGRKASIKAIGNVWKALGDVLTPIKDAFRDIFPPMTGKRLLEITQNVRKFTRGLLISDETASLLRRTFAGVFSIFSIVGKVVGAIADQVGRLFGAVSEGSGGFLGFTAGIGDALVALNDFLARSGVLESFFTGLGDILSVPLKILSGIGGLIGGLFGGFDAGTVDKVSGAVDKFGNALSPLEEAGARVGNVFEKVGEVFGNAAEFIGSALSKIGSLIANAFTPEVFSESLNLIQTGLLAGIVIMLRRFFSGGLNIDVGGGMFESVKESLGAVTETLQNMQASLKADILLKIAAALGILTASIVILSMIDGKKLAKALGGMGVGLGVLSSALVILASAINSIGAVKLPFIAAAMVGLAAAMLLMAAAVKIFESMDFGEMLRGLFGLGTTLFIIQKAMKPLIANSGGIVRVGAALLLLGVALNLMAVSLKIFASMSWEEMGQGLAGVAGAMLTVATAMKLMPKGIVLQAAAILILSAALNAMGLALKIFASMTWEEMAKGLSTLAGALVIIAAAMRLMPKGILLQAAALIAVSVALNLIGVAVKNMGSMGWEEIAKGLTTLGGALLILAAGLNLMTGTVMGAAALTIAAGALTMLAPVLIVLGSLDWATILKSLTMLAGIFTVLGLAGFVLAPLVPVILGLGAALILIGGGLALAGAGALAFATAFSVIIATGAAGVQILAEMLGTIISSIPKAMAAFGRGIVSFAKAIAAGGPQFVQSMSRIISNMLDAIIKNVPKMGRAFLVMLNTGLRVIVQATPKIVNAGIRLIISFLSAIQKNIGKITNIAAGIIVNFLNGISRNIGRIIQAGVNLIIKFIDGVSRAINNNSHRLGEAGGRLAIAMVNGVANGIRGAAGIIKDAALSAARSAWEAAKDFFKIGSPSKLLRDELGKPLPQGMALGIKDDADLPVRELEAMGKTAMDTLTTTMSGLSDAFKMEADMNPVVAPVLDLSKLTREANRMNAILATSPIDASVSYRRASDISTETQAVRAEMSETAGQPSITEIKLEQNNYSPKALSAVDIYRSTRNQLSLAKEALSNS